jgi:hypothetical protein
MTIDELITYCEEKEHNHRLSCKRYDDASGYTRSKDKNIRTACAIREEKYADYYKEISATMRKYQKIKKIANDKNINGDLLRMSEIRWVLKDEDDD